MLFKKSIADGNNLIDQSKEEIYNQLSNNLFGNKLPFNVIKEKRIDYDTKITEDKFEKKDIYDYTITDLLFNFYTENNFDKYLSTLLFAKASDAFFYGKEYANEWFSSINKIKESSIFLHKHKLDDYALALDLWEVEWLIEINQINEAINKHKVIKHNHPELSLLNNKDMTEAEYVKNILMQTYLSLDAKLLTNWTEP